MQPQLSLFQEGRVGLKAHNAYSDSDLELWKKYKQGNQQAKWDLLKRFHGVITSNARKLSNVRPYSVVEAELKELTLKAFDTFNPARGAKLSTHVVNTYKKLVVKISVTSTLSASPRMYILNSVPSLRLRSI